MKKLIFYIIVVSAAFAFKKTDKPVLYIIGDSTVRNGDGSGKNQQWGWGSFMWEHFDTTRVSISNQAIGGRSSRTFITEGRWEKVLNTLKKGDYVIMQFGHNDGGPLDDTARARGTMRGIGNDSTATYNPIRKVSETVYAYGWYMRKYIRDTKARGAVPIVCSPVPRNDWKDGKVIRSKDSYAGWSEQVAKEEDAYFIDLNELIAKKYEQMGSREVTSFFPVDHTHTNIDGAKLNAQIVADAIALIKPQKLQKYLTNK